VILVDAGPMVALVDGADQHHAACREALAGIDEPLATVMPAFTEAMYLLSDVHGGQAALWGLVEEAPIHFLDVSAADFPRIRELMATYGDRPMDLADAALVRAAEREGWVRIFTVDRTDFTVYRLNGQETFELIP
jgi:uncharacterized protein